jgi:hypothetical protein
MTRDAKVKIVRIGFVIAISVAAIAMLVQANSYGFLITTLSFLALAIGFGSAMLLARQTAGRALDRRTSGWLLAAGTLLGLVSIYLPAKSAVVLMSLLLGFVAAFFVIPGWFRRFRPDTA